MMGFIALILFVLIAVVGVRWAAELWRRTAPPVAPGMGAERLERLESTLASLEARLDDLQEQQRFLERLLAKRQEPGSLPPGREEKAVDSILFDTDREEG